MQVDLGARLVICAQTAVAFGYFVVIIAKPTSSYCLLFHIFFSFRILYDGRWAGLHVLLTKSFDEISNTSWPLTAAVSFAVDIHKSSFDQASSYG